MAKEHSSNKRSLMFACLQGDASLTEYLIQKGANVNERTQGGQGDMVNETPLTIACRLGHKAVVRKLLEAGANPDDTRRVLRTNGRRESCLALACAADSAEMVDMLLQAGADPQGGEAYESFSMSCSTQRFDKDTRKKVTCHVTKTTPPQLEHPVRPFCTAVANRNEKILRLLLQAGADPDLPSQNAYKKGKEPWILTPRDMAKIYGFEQRLEEILQKCQNQKASTDTS